MKLVIDFEERLWKELKSAMRHEPTSLDGYQQPIANGIPYEGRPNGEWIEHKQAEEVDGHLISNYECSCCHSWKRENTDFCPNCGADMRKKAGEAE